MSGSGQLRQVLAYLNSLHLTTQVAWPPVGLNARGYTCVCCIGESNEEEGHRMVTRCLGSRPRRDLGTIPDLGLIQDLGPSDSKTQGLDLQ